jgi:hypothetical protein
MRGEAVKILCAGRFSGPEQVAAHQALDVAEVFLELDVDCHDPILAGSASLSSAKSRHVASSPTWASTSCAPVSSS